MLTWTPGHLYPLKANARAQIRILQRPHSKVSRFNDLVVYVVGMGLEIRLHPRIRGRHST